MVFRRWVWLKCIGVVSGCCCKEVYAFSHNYYLALFDLFLLFFAERPYFLFISFHSCFFCAIL